MVISGQKEYVRYKEGAELFSVGERTFMNLAKEANAVRKIKGICLVHVTTLRDYIETMYS
ncbi:MAG: hypothetical protein IIV45_04200 [Lachnospiraceae bacterium]|nr:hypothetical protein [Lachnospiraceae bacterium]